MPKNKPVFKKAAIIGVGLIGGSLGLVLKQKRIAAEIIGVARHRRTLNLAKRCGAIDMGSRDIEVIRDADLVILATPVDTILGDAKRLAGIIKKDALVTDVGSTKKEIVSSLEKLFANYVGSHPLAGSQKSGVGHSCAGMFRGSLCVLTPTPKSSRQAVKRLCGLWKACGAKLAVIPPQEHDRIMALVSHLPHLVAFGLIDLIPRPFFKFAASGLKDTTRIAGSEANLWKGIFITNRKEVLRALKEFEQRISQLKRLIANNDRVGLCRFISKAKEKRDGLR